MTTPDDRRAIIVEQTGIAMKAARDRELATRRAEAAEEAAETFRTAAGFLWQMVKAAYDEYLEYEQLSDATMEQMLMALKWTAQEGDAG
jgi:hypothetical protein